MNLRTTALWILAAAGLFAFIFFYQRHQHLPPPPPTKVVPTFKAAEVTSVQVRPRGQLEIRAARTNDGWELTTPLRYPAQVVSIESFLSAVERLAPATYIKATELKDQARADDEYGFTTPQASIIMQQGQARIHLLIGTRTIPGDQVFLQVVGIEGVYVVDADFLKVVPASANDWRDTTLLNLKGLAFDRVTVTNGPKVFELQHDFTNNLWRMVVPIPARADHVRLEDSLEKLQSLRIRQFVSDDPKVDLETLGLQPPDLDLVLSQGTNHAVWLQFGKAATNDGSQVYARRVGRPAIVTVSKDLLASWRASVNDFRDPHLLALTAPVETIEVRGQDAFSLLLQTNLSWRVMPQNFPADPLLVREMLSGLTGMQVIQFTKDFVTEPELPDYGLASPVRRYILESPNAMPGSNAIIADLSFGTNKDDKVYFARRADEIFVYAIKRTDLDPLPFASWQLRDRQFWNFPVDDVVRATIRQQGKTRQVIRKGPHQWSLAPGSQGMINDLAIEETVSGLGRLAAVHWVARGERHRADYGFTADSLQLNFELKNGEQLAIQFGGEARPNFPYAAVTLDGELWIFEFPGALYQHVLACLTIPPGLP